MLSTLKLYVWPTMNGQEWPTTPSPTEPAMAGTNFLHVGRDEVHCATKTTTFHAPILLRLLQRVGLNGESGISDRLDQRTTAVRQESQIGLIRGLCHSEPTIRKHRH